jgi:hypothetical protein
MRPSRRASAAAKMPTISDGQPPDPEIQQQVLQNQARTAAQWNDTARDMVISNIVNERERVRETRWELITLAVLGVILLVLGSIYTYNNYVRDRFVEDQRAAAESTPYRPETTRP